MIKHSLAITTVLLLAAAQAIAGQVRSVADLKADLGFAERQVQPAGLGLKDKEVLTARLFDGPLVKGKYAFDEKMLMMAIEGMINRHGPLVFLDLTPSGWRGDATWLKYYGETRAFRFVGQEQDFASFLKRTSSVFNGIILYDPLPSDNHWLAMNLASLNFCLPVSRRIYDAHRDCFGKLPVVVELPNKALTRTEINDWMIQEILPKTDLTAAYTPAVDFSDLKRFVAFTGKWMREGATTREIILWEGRDPAVQKAYADGIPELRGLTVKPEQIYPWGEMLVAGSRDVPVLREPCATQYWMLNQRFVTHNNYGDPEKVRQFHKGLRVNVEEFVRYLDELDHHVEKPYCFMAYGLQINLPSEVGRIQDALDAKRFEIVDMGTLCHLAGQVAPRLKQEAAAMVDPKKFPAVAQPSADTVAWQPALLHDIDRWKPYGKAVVSGGAAGLRLQIPAGSNDAAVALPGVMIPTSATRVRIRVSDIQGCRWVLEMHGDFESGPTEAINIEGRREKRLQASWQPFSEWSPHRRFPESDDRPLDKRFITNALQGRPVTLWLKVQGSEGGHAVFESLEFANN